jgi:anti-anti-sigma factor
MNDKQFDLIQNEKYSIISVTVEKLDTHVAPVIKSQLIEMASKGICNIIIDLSQSRYCDSSGLSAILVANRLCKNAGGNFVLTGLQSAVERLISISQLDTVLNITDNLDQAKAFIEAKIGEN